LKVQSAGKGNHSDGRGLFLRVRDDSASWVLRYTAPDGRRRERGLGVVDRSSLAAIGKSLATTRREAVLHHAKLLGSVDPLDERDQKREAGRKARQERDANKQRERWTLARCARDYHERVIEKSRTVRHAASWISSLEQHVPASVWNSHIDDTKPAALLRALVAAQPHERARRPGDLSETLRRVRQRLDAVCEDAQFHERCTTNPARAIRRKLSDERPKLTRKQNLRALPYAELPALMARVRAMRGTAARCLEFAALTAARTSEALYATWDEFDTAAAAWTVKAERMKLRQLHRVHLSPRALAIIEAQRGQDATYVFPSVQPGREGKPMSNMAMLTVLNRLGVRNRTTVHGLCRRTFSTWANETGAARPDVIEAALAHSEEDRVRAAYNAATFDAERRALLAKWADYLERPALALVA
jgi:integrase